MKQKLLLALLALITGGSVHVWATDYITNGDNLTYTKRVAGDPTTADVKESWCNNASQAFDLSQEVTTLPAGVYTLSLQAMYRASYDAGTNTNCVVYATTGGSYYDSPLANFGDVSGTTESLGGVTTAMETSTNYMNTLPYFIVEEDNATVRVGARSIGALTFCNNGYWFIWKTSSFIVSDVTDATILAQALADVKAEVKEILDAAEASAEKTALQNLYDNAEATGASIAALKKAIRTYAGLMGTATTPLDVTSVYVDNGDFSQGIAFANGNTNNEAGRLNLAPMGWTNTDSGSGQYNYFSIVPNNTSGYDGQSGFAYNGKTTGNTLYMRHAWGASNMSATQTITLPEGRYKISIPAKKTGKTAKVSYTFAGETTENNVTTDWALYEKTFDATQTNNTLTITLSYVHDNGGGQRAFFDGVTLTAYGDPLKAIKAELASKQLEATNLLSNNAYENVIGAERAELTTQSTATAASETSAAYQAVIDAVTNAIDAFVAAKAKYDALIAEIAYAKSIGVAAATADAYAATTTSTAATVVTATENLKVDEYTHITTTYTESATLGTWTETFAEDLNGEGYVADGPKYWNEWGTNTRTGKQTVTLPAGDYAVSVIARGGIGSSGYLYYKLGNEAAVTTDFVIKGNRGRGVNTSGVASFSDGDTYTCNNEGFGWEYRYLTFTLTAETSVELGVSATFANNWVSVYAPTLLTTEASVKNLRLAEIADALTNVPTGNMNATVKSTLDAKKAAAQAASTSNTKEELATILSELNDAIAAANTSIAEYTKISDYLTTASTSFPGDYSTISAAITAGSYENSVDGMAAVKALRSTIATTNMTAGKDLTGLIDNNSFELGNTDFWTVEASSDTGARDADNYKMSNQHGNYVFNTWWKGNPITQAIGKLPAGAYKLQGVVASDGGTIYVTMNDKHEAYVETADNKSGSSITNTKVGIEFDYVFTLDAEQDVTIGVVGGADGTRGAHKDYTAAGYWFYKVDNFRLTYLGATAPANTLDGTYVLTTGGAKINRGGDSGTEAVMQTSGLPVTITTDKAGISTILFTDNSTNLFYNDEMVYTDKDLASMSTYHKPYWKISAVTGGYNILNTQSGLYLTTTTATRNGSDITVATLSETPAVWTLEDPSLDAAKAELKAAIDAVVIPTANIGANAFQVPTAQVTAATDAKAAAQAVYDDATATKTQVDDAKTTFEAAIAGVDLVTLNAPADDQLFNIINNSDGYNHKGKAVTFKSASNADLATNSTSMGYNENPGSIYPQAVKFTPVSGVQNGYTLSYTRADGNVVFVGTGSSTGLGNNNNQIRPTTDASKAVTIQVKNTSTDGVWNLYNTLANQTIGANGANDQGFYTTGSYNSMKLQEAVKPTVPLNIAAANQYGTLILPFSTVVPAGVVAYSVSTLTGSTLNMTAATAFEANTPYVVFAEAGATATLEGYGAAYTDASYTAGLLTGVFTETAAPVGSYVLQKLNDKVAFYIVVDGSQPNVPAYRTYLTAPSSSAKALFFGDADVTGIDALDALMNGEATIYNASGVEQNKLQKGMNIIKMKNGATRKIMVK